MECPAYPVVCDKCNKDGIPRSQVSGPEIKGITHQRSVRTLVIAPYFLQMPILCRYVQLPFLFRTITVRSPPVWSLLIYSHSFVQMKSNKKPAGNCPRLLIGYIGYHQHAPSKGFFSLLKPEFSGTSINCFHGFLTRSDREGALIAEWRAKTFKINFEWRRRF